MKESESVKSFDKQPMVRVVWMDAKSCDRLYASEIPDSLRLAPYIVAGFKVAEDPEALVICEGIQPPIEAGEETVYTRPISIPKVLITRIEELTIRG